MLRIIMMVGIMNAATCGAALAQDFNPYVLKSVDYLFAHYAKRGYDINAAFTHNMDYGGRGVIKARRPPQTMCVAAVAETIIEAIKLYGEESGDKTVFDKIPVTAWTRGNVLSLTANIFMYSGTGSHGTGFTLESFGLGEEVPFESLKPGDFVNFNRTTKSGHGVVFLGFLKPDLSRHDLFSPDVVGFRYFSSQGKGRPDAGFGYRNGFFSGFCPNKSDFPRDCNIIRSANTALFNSGRMSSPSTWAYLKAVEDKRNHVRSAIEGENPGATRGAIDLLVDQETQQELHWDPTQEKAFEDE